MARSQLLKNYLPDGEVNLITKEAGKNTSDRNDKKEKKRIFSNRFTTKTT